VWAVLRLEGGTAGDCPEGYFFSETCDGTATFDTACVACADAGECPDGYYHNASTTLCDGSTTFDERCVACSSLGTCATGEYFDESLVRATAGRSDWHHSITLSCTLFTVRWHRQRRFVCFLHCGGGLPNRILSQCIHLRWHGQ